MKKLTAFALFCIIWSCAKGQTNVPKVDDAGFKIIDWPVDLTRVHFKIADSTYDYTLFREPNGLLYFGQGFDHVDDSLPLFAEATSVSGTYKKDGKIMQGGWAF